MENAPCPDCGKHHDDVPDELDDLIMVMAEDFTSKVFPQVWKVVKEEVKQMSKHELAEEMFYTGAVEMITGFLESTQDMQINNQEKKEK